MTPNALTTTLVPAPTVCPVCRGEQFVVVTEYGPHRVTGPCPGCCCVVCGQATDTPPECKRCAIVALPIAAPTACLTCGGDGVRLRHVGERVVTEPCSGCRCWCGAATDTPPECREHATKGKP